MLGVRLTFIAAAAKWLAEATYCQRITHFTEALGFLSEEDKDWIMGRGILARLNWA